MGRVSKKAPVTVRLLHEGSRGHTWRSSSCEALKPSFLGCDHSRVLYKWGAGAGEEEGSNYLWMIRLNGCS